MFWANLRCAFVSGADDPGWKGLLLDRCRKYIRSRVRGSHRRRSDGTPLGALRSIANNRRAGSSQLRSARKYLIPPPAKKGLHGGGFGPHPRSEANGLSEAAGTCCGQMRLLRDAPNRNAEPVRSRKHSKHVISPLRERLTDLHSHPNRGPGQSRHCEARTCFDKVAALARSCSTWVVWRQSLSRAFPWRLGSDIVLQLKEHSRASCC
jgi:hypothetical protein